MSRLLMKTAYCWLAGVMVAGGSGCTMFGYIQAIPANRVPASLLARSKDDMQEISLSRLRRTPPDPYQIGPGDVLGIYVERLIEGPQIRNADAADFTQGTIPYQLPQEIGQPAYVGIPFPVREDGTISLPYTVSGPLDVEGLTLAQVEELIRREFTVRTQQLVEGYDAIVVTIQQKRTHQVFVVREEEGARSRIGQDTEVVKRGAGFSLELKEGENDLLHALNETGGLPGLDAKNEVVIIRGLDGFDGKEWDQLVAQIKSCREPCSCPPDVPDPPNITRIPLRFFSDNVPGFTEQDIVLNTGDIVLIESRERELFYTGGALGGGEFPLPRDRDLDILGAIAVAGGPVGSSGAVLSQIGGGRGNVSGSGGGSGPLPPTDAIIIRELCDGSQLPIRVDLKKAYTDSSQRILIRPEDVLILRYKCSEETFNTLISLIQFNFLFNGFGGNGF